MRTEHPKRPLPQSLLLCPRMQQVQKYFRNLTRLHHPHCVRLQKHSYDVAKVLREWSYEDRLAVASRLQNVVSASIHQASAHECDIRDRIHRGQLADRIEQEDAAGDRLT